MDINQIPEIKKLMPFLALSKSIEPTNILLSYYLKSYATKKAYQIYQTLSAQGQNLPQLMDTINQWLQQAELLKNTYPSSFATKEHNQQQITDFALDFFFQCDNLERNNDISKQLAMNFLVCSRYLEVLNIFGPISKDLDQKRIYAKAKSSELMKCLNNPQLMEERNKKFMEQNQQNDDDINIDEHVDKIELNNQQIKQSVFQKQQSSLNNQPTNSDSQLNQQPLNQQLSNQQQFQQPCNQQFQQLSNINNNQQQQVSQQRYNQIDIRQLAQNVERMNCGPKTREGVVDQLKYALSELDFKNYEQSIINLMQAKQIIRHIR